MFSKKTKFAILFFAVATALFLPLHHTFAVVDLKSQIQGNIDAGSNVAGLGHSDPRSLIAGVISIFLSLIGITFTLLIVMAGYNLLTAAGDESKVEKAKNTIKACVIGLAITLSAYGITTFVGKSAVQVSTQGAQPPINDKLDYTRLKNDINDAINNTGNNVN